MLPVSEGIVAEIHKILCPYCIIGWAEVVIDRGHGDFTQFDYRTPRKCVKCGSYFKLKARLQIDGVKLDD